MITREKIKKYGEFGNFAKNSTTEKIPAHEV